MTKWQIGREEGMREPTDEDYRWAIQDDKGMTDPNKRFCELAGICWHKSSHPEDEPQTFWCIHCREFVAGNIDYASDPVAVLREMMWRDDFDQFMAFLLPVGNCKSYRETSYRLLGIIVNNPNAMIQAAIKFMED